MCEHCEEWRRRAETAEAANAGLHQIAEHAGNEVERLRVQVAATWEEAARVAEGASLDGHEADCDCVVCETAISIAAALRARKGSESQAADQVAPRLDPPPAQ